MNEYRLKISRGSGFREQEIELRTSVSTEDDFVEGKNLTANCSTWNVACIWRGMQSRFFCSVV